MITEDPQRPSFKRVTTIVAVALFLSLPSCLMSKAAKKVASRSDMGPLEAFIQKEVHDPDRAHRMKEVVAELKRDLKVFQAELTHLEKGYAKLNASYEAKPDDFMAFFTDFDAKRKDLRVKMLNAHFRLKELATSEERQRMLQLEAEALREATKGITQPTTSP